ncbi:MAG: ABC transporter ATP-binding protein [Vampirovibrionales bacterium]|nr:ABC transporter ATP-binding protein [Vampirovibrionales bacterium]
MSDACAEALLAIEGLSVHFPTDTGEAAAVHRLDLTLNRGQILGLVGESGCGKSLTSLAILRLVPQPGRIVSGRICFEGQDLLTLPERQMRKIRGARIAMIPQDPLTSLNPVYTIGDQLVEAIQLHQRLSRAEARQRAVALLDQVRLPQAAQRLDDYPHQFSGGMRQRVMIAMALSCSPDVLIADEPTTALDVTVQAQILRLMQEIQRERQLAILLITHDLGVVAEVCDSVAVMYAGRLIEQGPTASLFAQPSHPYTQGLLRSLPVAGRQRLEPIEGQPPTITEIPSGCAFEPRCAFRMPRCVDTFPPAFAAAPDQPDHTARCFLLETPSRASAESR